MAGQMKRRPTPRPRPGLGLWVLAGILVLLAGYLAALDNSRPHVTGDALTYSNLVDQAEKGHLQDARMLGYDSYVVGHYVKDHGIVAEYNSPYLTLIGPDVLNMLVFNRVPTTIDQQTTKQVASLATYLVPTLILILLLAYLVISYRRGTGLFGIRSGARQINPEDSRVTFADVAGQDAAIADLREVVDFLRDPQRFAALGARIPKGVLMYGPPGCGKTLLARALAGEAGANFYSISGSDFVEVYVGVGAARVRDLFKVARENSPALIFVDEIDAVGRARGGDSVLTSHAEQEQALNAILTEMDGFAVSDGIIVLGATNRPDILDPALLRPGRFDRTVGLERPDAAGRLAILILHARGKSFEPEVDLAAVARQAVGLTGADLAAVVNEAALLSGRGHRSSIGPEDLAAALHRVLEAPERQRRLSMRQAGIGRRAAGEEKVTFGDVAGMDDAIAELAEVRDYLVDPERFTRLGARVPRGILLNGPPGCGKTLLARAVAGEANAAFFSAAASEFVEIFAGQGAARVRDLFAQARAVPPAIVFLDEIDAIGGSRSAGAAGGQREIEQTLNQILVEMDGFDVRGGVIVMAATNRPDMLDAALVRPGRFDRRIAIEPPNRVGRQAILAIHARGKILAPDVDLEVVARRTSGSSGADLANILNEAALLAARQRLGEVPMSLVDEAIDRAAMGIASPAKLLSEEERCTIAYHEAGHALVSRSLPGVPSARKVSIVRRGHTLGATLGDHDEDRLTHSRSTLVDHLATMLAGRVGELVVFEELGSGAADDLRNATRLARMMVTQLGMSDALGPVVYADPAVRHSDEIARLIDSEVRALIDEASERARRVLTGARPALDRIAAALLENETLESDRIDQLISTAPVLAAVVSPAQLGG